jgi:hypothetical protein
MAIILTLHRNVSKSLAKRSRTVRMKKMMKMKETMRTTTMSKILSSEAAWSLTCQQSYHPYCSVHCITA